MIGEDVKNGVEESNKRCKKNNGALMIYAR